MIAPATLDFARAEARKRWSFASPYRVGIVVGNLGLIARNPYKSGSPAAKNYEEGIEWGRRHRDQAGG